MPDRWMAGGFSCASRMTGMDWRPTNARAPWSAASGWMNPCPGTGLGLAIVRDIAKLYGGTITLGEASLGGLEARLELPRAA